jgi:hypothetical protein
MVNFIKHQKLTILQPKLFVDSMASIEGENGHEHTKQSEQKILLYFL